MIRSISSSDSEEASFAITEQERILKNSNIFKQKNQGHNNCMKHPNKKVNYQSNQAKYYAQCDRSKLFCSKCALTLALKGLKIEETQENQLELQRQNRIFRFQEQLKQTLEQCKAKLIELSSLENSSQQQLQGMTENCIQFFDALISTAYQLKPTYISKFQNDHQQLVKSIQEKMTGIKNLDEQLKQFEIDIEKNHDNIVKKMEMKPFDDIMKRYEQRVAQTRMQLQEFHQEFQPKQITIDKNSILSNMNKMCYNLLLNSEEQIIEQPMTTVLQENSPLKIGNSSVAVDMKVFEILEAEDIYQSTCSNQIKEHLQSPLKQQQSQKQKGSTFSNPLSAIQNSRRESHSNTPESWQLRTCIAKTNPLVTPNERESFKHNISIGEQIISQKCQNGQLEVNDQYFGQQNEKQKTDCERNSEKCNNYPLLSNLSCLQIQKANKEKETDRRSFEDRELTPKHSKNQTTGPQTFKLLTNHASQRCTKCNILAQYQYPQINNNLFEQKSQKELSKGHYDSVPNQKSLTPHHQEPQTRVNQQRQDQLTHKRSNSKQPKQPSMDQNEGKRQFIVSNMAAQYTSQPSQHSTNENTLKDRILKELCTHPGESVYNQVLKLNNQSKLKNQKVLSKENFEQSTTVRDKNSAFFCGKKQSQQQ